MSNLKKLLFFLISVTALAVSLWTLFIFAYFISTQDQIYIKPLNFMFQESPKDSFLYPALWNGFLVCVFVLQHTGMASAAWKHFLADMKLFPISRAIYVLMTCLALQGIVQYWSPLPSRHAVWFLDTSERPGLWLFFFLLHVICWTVIYLATFLMDTLDLLGFKQVHHEYLGLNDPVTYKAYEEQKLLKHMRHPGTTCLLIILWAHPLMTLQRFFLAFSLTLYLLFGFAVNDKDYEYVRHQVVHKRVIVKKVFTTKLA